MMSSSSPEGSKKKAKPLPVINLEKLLGHTSRSPTKSGPATAHSSGFIEDEDVHHVPVVKEFHRAEQNSSAATLANSAGSKVMLVSSDRSGPSSSFREGSPLKEVSNYVVSGGFLAKAKLDGDSARMQDSTAPPGERVSDSRSDAETSQAGQGYETLPLEKERDEETSMSTPKSTSRFQEIPSSTDSSQDEMTLAEMKSLVNRLGPHAPGTMSPTNRSLTLALNAISSNTENIDPHGGGATATTGIVSSTRNRCVLVSPTPSKCSG